MLPSEESGTNDTQPEIFLRELVDWCSAWKAVIVNFLAEEELVEVLRYCGCDFFNFLFGIKSSYSLLCFHEPLAAFLKEIGFSSTDQHSVANPPPPTFLEAARHYIEDLVNLKN